MGGPFAAKLRPCAGVVRTVLSSRSDDENPYQGEVLARQIFINGDPSGKTMQILRFVPLLAVLCCSDPTGVSSQLRDRWFEPQQDASYSRPVVVGNLVIFGTGDGFLVGRNKSTGAVAWRTTVGEQVAGSRLVARDDVVVALLVWTTVGVNATTGDIRWTYKAPLDTVGGRPLPGQLQF